MNHSADSTERSMSNADIDDIALLRDDVLIDALAKGVFPAEYADDPMVGALWSWREDLVNGPADVAVAAGTVWTSQEQEAPAPKQRASVWSWLRLPQLNLGRKLAVSLVAATVGVVSLGSVAAASSAEPGSMLWPLSKVVNGDRAQSLEARQDAFDRLNEARTAARSNNTATAREHLAAALSDAEKVREKDSKELKEELAVMQARLSDTPTPSPSPSERPSGPPPSPSDSPSPSPSPSESPTESSSPSEAASSSPVFPKTASFSSPSRSHKTNSPGAGSS